MRLKSVLWWLAGLTAVVLVMTAGAWSLSTATAFADEPASAVNDKASTTKTADDPPDQLPGTSQLPLQEKVTASGDVKPATFTISGKKYLEGRPLKAGEFSFTIAEAGAYKVPARSDLPKQLKSDTLTPDEKYQLVAYSGFDYHPNSLQPLPNPSTVTNAADGTVAFPAITIEGKALGETATSRHLGIVFCYNIVEQPPQDADGQLLEGVTKDAQGRYVYQGVTYDDCVKHLYLYAYETVNEDRSSSVAIIPLGDATFDGVPVRTASGKGVGFRNSFSGAVLESYDGLVFLGGEAIAAGEFNFDVHEVTETGSLIEDQHVACAAGAGGAQGAEVPVISDAAFDKAGTYYFAVSQQAPAKSEAARVKLDDTAYAVTVQVAEGADSTLDASVVAVRKKAADSNQWTEVALDAKPSPLVWDNRVVKDEGVEPDKPGSTTPDAPGTTTPDKPDTDGSGSGSGTTTPDAPAPDKPDKPGDSSQPTEPDKPGGVDQPGTTVPPEDTDGAGGSEGDGDAGDSGATETPDQPSAPDQGTDTDGDGSTAGGSTGGTTPGGGADGSTPDAGPGADISGNPDDNDPDHGGDAPDEGGVATKPEGGQGTTIETTPSHEGAGVGSEDDQDAGGAASDSKGDANSSDKTSISLATKPFAQTGDTLAVGMIALAVLAAACVIVLIIARKRRQ